MRRSTFTKLAPRLVEVGLGTFALGFSILCCIKQGTYYYSVNTYEFTSLCWASGGLVVLEGLGLHVAKQPKDAQWQTMGLVLDCLALACGITSLVLLTVIEASSYPGWQQIGYWLPPMIAFYLCIFALIAFILMPARFSLHGNTATASHYPLKDVEQTNSWYVAEPEYYRPEPSHVPYDNRASTRKVVPDLDLKSNRASRPLSEADTVARWSEGSGQQTLSHPSVRSSDWKGNSYAAPCYDRDMEKRQSTISTGT